METRAASKRSAGSRGAKSRRRSHPSGPPNKKSRRGGIVRGGAANDPSLSRREASRRVVTRCACCDASIPAQESRVQILPCMHELCSVCALRSQIERGSAPHRCPAKSCGAYSTGCRCCGSAGGSVDIPNVVEGEDTFAKQYLPYDWLIDQHIDEIEEDPEYNEAFVFYCSRVQLDDAGDLVDTSVTSSFVLRKRGDVAFDGRTIAELRNFFAFLHQPLLHTSNLRSKHLPVFSPREYLERRCSSMRPIDAALFSLGTGIVEFDRELYLQPGNQDHQRQYLAAIVASDVLLRNIRPTPGFFQLMFGELLQRQKFTRDFRDLCSCLSLAPSRKYSLKDRAGEAMKQLKEGFLSHQVMRLRWRLLRSALPSLLKCVCCGRDRSSSLTLVEKAGKLTLFSRRGPLFLPLLILYTPARVLALLSHHDSLPCLGVLVEVAKDVSILRLFLLCPLARSFLFRGCRRDLVRSHQPLLDQLIQLLHLLAVSEHPPLTYDPGLAHLRAR